MATVRRQWAVAREDYSERAVAAAREAFLRGDAMEGAPVRPVVLESWRRCHEYGVSPALTRVPRRISADEVAHWLAGSELARSGEGPVAMAGSWLRGTGHAVILCDAAGTVLAVDGDPALLGAADSIGCAPGAGWEEPCSGNSGIASSLVLGQPVHFVGQEHYCAGWQEWTCAAVPVRDPETRRWTGVVDISGYRRPPSLRALRMALDVARQIERLLRGQAARRRNVLLSAALARMERAPGSGLLAVDRGGAVVWASERAAERVGPNLHQGGPWPAAALLPGLPPLDRPLGPAEYGPEPGPCTALPVWHLGEWAGHLLLLEPERRTAAAARAGAAVPGSPAAPRDGAPAAPRAGAPAPRDGAPAVPRGGSPDVARVVARRGDRRLLLAPDQVYLARAAGGGVELLTQDGPLPAEARRLPELEATLAPLGFFRTDRAHLVNLARVREVLPLFNRTVRLVLADRRHTEVPVARRRTAELCRRLGL